MYIVYLALLLKLSQTVFNTLGCASLYTYVVYAQVKHIIVDLIMCIKYVVVDLMDRDRVYIFLDPNYRNH